MDEYELSLDNVFFFDAQIVGEKGEEFIASLVWLHDFQWSSWTQGVDEDGVFVRQWLDSDVIVCFDPDGIVMELMKHQFGLDYEAVINLVDYCDDDLTDTAHEIDITYPPELDALGPDERLGLWIEHVEGNKFALNNLLFANAWRTALIYYIFFEASGEEVPIKIFVPWQFEEPKVYKQVPHRPPEKKINILDKDLYENLRNAYDFSKPGATDD